LEVFVPTLKKRINLSLDDQLYSALEKLCKRNNDTLAGLSTKLIERAMEIEEDQYFSRIADKRLEANEKRLSHKKAWD
jgi:predicted DNA-binding protein